MGTETGAWLLMFAFVPLEPERNGQDGVLAAG
jgi:hypothetical protein